MNYRYAVKIVSFIHLMWAFIILTYGKMPLSTTLAPIYNLFHFKYPFGALTLIGTSLLALCSFRVRQLELSVAMTLPQQFLLVLSSYGAISAVITSSFADGVVRPWQFIAVDQVYAVVIFCAYTIALLQHYESKLVPTSSKPEVWNRK